MSTFSASISRRQFLQFTLTNYISISLPCSVKVRYRQFDCLGTQEFLAGEQISRTAMGIIKRGDRDRSSVMPRIANHDVAVGGARDRFGEVIKCCQIFVVGQDKQMMNLAAVEHWPFDIHEVVADANAEPPKLTSIEDPDCRVMLEHPA